jgi:hypothetical protein
MAANDSIRRAHNFKDLTGKRFGRLTVLKLNGFVEQSSKRIACWWCQCQCGDRVVVMAGNLRKGNTRSCGCLARDVTKARLTTHGMTISAEYRSWSHLIGRCYNRTDRAYESYGGRGIIVCKRWRTSFEDFLEDMGPKPEGFRISIERRDNDGNYEKSNCYWGTPKQQSRNRRNNRMLTFDGRTQCLGAWAEEIGISQDVLRARLLKLGWSVERALTTPVRHCRAPASSSQP